MWIRSALAFMLVSSFLLPVSAQTDATADASPQVSYAVCDWGLISFDDQTTQSATFIEIDSPANYSAVAADTFTVSGTGAGLFEGNVVVEVTTAHGDFLFEEATTLHAETMGAVGDWSVDVNLEGLSEPMEIAVRAYATSPEDGSTIAFDSILLNAGSAFGVRYVEITAPYFRQGVHSSPLQVSGMAGGAFENNIVIEVRDFESKAVLAETFATVETDDVGGSGAFSTEVTFDAEPGTTIEVHAYQPDMSDGEAGEEISDIQLAVASPLAQTYDRMLYLKQDDPILAADDLCAAAEIEFDNENISLLTIHNVMVVSTMSTMPLVNVSIAAAGSSVCAAPIRVRINNVERAFAIEAYRDTTNPVPCTADLAPIPLQVSLGTQPDTDYSITVNGAPVE